MGVRTADKTVTRDLYDRLIAVNQDAFVMGLFNAAYHALAGALHCARELQDADAIKHVKDIATVQLVWIDQNAPEYEHSTRSAQTRGNDSIFGLLVRQAAASADLVHQRNKLNS